MLLVSECLTGAKCRYNGQGKPQPAVIELLKGLQLGRDYLLICPESAGGLPIPRLPGEITNGDAAAVWQGRGRVVNSAGEDYTAAFLRGARLACQTAAECGAKAALLKENSPSCGVAFVHDGSFKGGLVPGPGVAALALAAQGLQLFSEEEIESLTAWLQQSRAKQEK